MRVMVELDREELKDLQFPVVVEMWEKVMGSMTKKRLYHEAFNYREREVISQYHKRFHAWYLKTGTPESCSMYHKTLELLKRAIDFFASI